MDHPAIDQLDVVERYLRGSLTAEEQLAFEQHFLHCQRCLTQLEDAEAFGAALKRTAAAGLLEEPADAPPATRKEAKVLRFAGVAAPPSRWLALAALLLLAAGVPYLFLREEAARRNDELEALAQQRENERAQAASAQAEAETERQRLAQVNLEQAERLKALEGLLPAVQARLLPVFLAAVRGDDDAGPEIHVAPDLDALLLVFELPGETLPAYRLRLLRANHEIWRAEPLAPGDLGLVVALPRTLLEAGSYRLEIVGLGRHETLVARPTFRVKLAG